MIAINVSISQNQVVVPLITVEYSVGVAVILWCC